MLIPIGFVMLGIFLLISRYRFIDGDEGFYLLASRLVFEGKLPYRDFLYLQTPLLPYFYGLWMKGAGVSWISARTLSALLAALLGMFLCADVYAKTRKWAAALSAGALFVMSTPVFAWLPIVKTYGISALLLFLSYMILTGRSAAPSLWACALSGLFLGINADTRSFMSGLIPVFLLWIYREVGIASRRSALLYFMGGFSMAVLPNLYFLALSPRQYLFGNLGYHAVRSQAGLIGDYSQKLWTLAHVVAISGTEGYEGVQAAILLTISLAAALIIRRPTAATRLAFQLTAALSLINLLPTPTFIQYFCVPIPLLITATVRLTSDLLDFLKAEKPRKVATSLIFACLAIFVSVSIIDVRRYLVTGDGVIGLSGAQDAINWRIDTVRAISRSIDAIISPGEPVMSFWPGYIFESKAVPVSGFENNFGLLVSAPLSPASLSQYHIVSLQRIIAELRAREPRVVVLGNQDYIGEYMALYGKALRTNSYLPVRNIGASSIYLRGEPPDGLSGRLSQRF
jgi:hypothetical protein